jgi:(2R)-ethylmalonyl-CoA mutase
VEATERIEQASEEDQLVRLRAWRAERDSSAVSRSIDELRRAAADDGADLMSASLAAARAGVTTGEWAGALRDVFGGYRPPTGLSEGSAATAGSHPPEVDAAREAVGAAARRLGVSRVRLLIGKPGLDGHSNAAEQVALRARDAGFEVIYQGIRLTPSQIARAAAEEDVHAVGLSVLSGAHGRLVADVMDRLRNEGVDVRRVPVVVGGVIPREDADALRRLGVARVFTPMDGDLGSMVVEVAELLGRSSG